MSQNNIQPEQEIIDMSHITPPQQEPDTKEGIDLLSSIKPPKISTKEAFEPEEVTLIDPNNHPTQVEAPTETETQTEEPA